MFQNIDHYAEQKTRIFDHYAEQKTRIFDHCADQLYKGPSLCVKYMENSEAIDYVIRRWNPWWKSNWKLPTFVIREIQEDFKKVSSIRHIKDIIGVRRCGKTTFLSQIINFWIDQGIVPQQIILINCDDFLIKQIDFDSLLKSIKLLSPEITHLILDEIQEKSGWENWVRTLYDTNQFQQIILTGSNTSLLTEDIGRVLSGRHISLILTPFSFKEFLSAKGYVMFSPSDIKANREEIQRYLIQYLKEGGFPEPTFIETEYEKNQIVLHLAKDIISRDIITKHAVDAEKINQLFTYIMTNFTHEFSYRKISNVLQIHPETTQSYIQYLKECFVIAELPLFSYKLTQQYHENKKVYVIDSGLRNTVGFYGMGEKGKLLENMVFWELYRKKKEIYFWKDGKHEVDFLVTKGMQVLQLIQVCWTIEDQKTMIREKAGIVAAAKLFNLSEGFIITLDNNFSEEYDGILIHFIRVVEWVLIP